MGALDTTVLWNLFCVVRVSLVWRGRSVPVGWEKGARVPWIIVTDEAAGPDTLRDYGLRFAIEEGFLDHKSGGFQWESSRRREVDPHWSRGQC